MVIDVYSRYYCAECVFNEIPRKGALVKLTSDSAAGNIRYTVSVTFFPYRDPEDFVISYDACAEKEIYNARGRRSKKREKAFMEGFEAEIDGLAASMGGRVLWDAPIRDAVTA